MSIPVEQLPLCPAAKRCNGPCGLLLPLDAFHRRRRSADGHVGKCKVCCKEYMTRYRSENRAALRAYDRIAREQKKERRRQQWRAWVQAHPDYYRHYKPAYYQANAADIRRKARDYYAVHSERERKQNRAWFARNRLKIREYTARRLERERNAPGRITAKEIALLIEVQGRRCAFCGAQLDASFHLDHLTPVTRGGSNALENRSAACQRCNNRKYTLTAGQFFARLIKEKRAQREQPEGAPATLSARLPSSERTGGLGGGGHVYGSTFALVAPLNAAVLPAEQTAAAAASASPTVVPSATSTVPAGATPTATDVPSATATVAPKCGGKGGKACPTPTP